MVMVIKDFNQDFTVYFDEGDVCFLFTINLVLQEFVFIFCWFYNNHKPGGVKHDNFFVL